MRITDHAVTRYQERVAPVDAAKARCAIEAAAHAVDVAAVFGCDRVKLGNGARLALDGDTVVTVLPKRMGRSRRYGA